MTPITIKERLAILETKIKSLQRTVWVLVVAVLGQTGINLSPILFSHVLQ